MSIVILCSDMTGIIYAATMTPNGKVRSKIDVTQQVINAVSKHMDITKKDYECAAGELIFREKCSDCFGEGGITVENFSDPESFDCPTCKGTGIKPKAPETTESAKR